MEIINKLIHWQKNIQKITHYKMSVFFNHDLVSIEAMKTTIRNNAKMIEDDFLYKRLQKSDFEYHSNDLSQTYEVPYNLGWDNGKPYVASSIQVTEFKNSNQLYCFFKMTNPSKGLQNLFLKTDSFKFMIASNPHYTGWENCKTPTAYKYKRGIKIKYIKETKVYRVDISNRPGRMVWLNGFAWHGGHEYWFGNSFYDIIPKDHILQFQYADEIKELPNGLLYLKLMDMHDYWTDKGQNRLLKLREHLEIDRLEKEHLESLGNRR